MKLFLLKRTDDWDYDDYDSCIVCANDEADAKSIGPEDKELAKTWGWAKKLSDIDCTEIGDANKDTERGVILASFNAG